MGTITPRVTSISSSRFDVVSGKPPSGNELLEWLEIEIEASDEFRHYGGEVFGMVVCTPAGMESRLMSEPVVWGHKHLLVAKWDVEIVRSAVQRLCDAAAGTEWNEVVKRLSRYLTVDSIDFDPN